MNDYTQCLVKLAELLEANNLPEYAQQVKDLIKMVSENKIDNRITEGE